MLESGSVSYGKATGYLPVIDLLKSYFGISERTAERIRDKVAASCSLSTRRCSRLCRPCWRCWSPGRGSGLARLDPAAPRSACSTQCASLLRESQEQPLLLIFEDLHWIDAETQAVLDSLVESLPTARIFLLVTYRPEYRHPWAAKTYYVQIGLDALRPKSAAELLDALLGKEAALAPLKQLLVRRATRSSSKRRFARWSRLGAGGLARKLSSDPPGGNNRGSAHRADYPSGAH